METMQHIKEWVQSLEFTIIDEDFSRPWGGFLVIDERESKRFASLFFPDISGIPLDAGIRLSPKILMVLPEKRLSWQYHHRRKEIWSVIRGPVGVSTSDTDDERTPLEHQSGDVVTLGCGERHRLVGMASLGIVAEFWIHTDLNHLSDESDIIRLSDDYSRN